MNFLDGRRRGWWASGAGQGEENEMVDKMFNVKQNKRGSYGFLNTISTSLIPQQSSNCSSFIY